MALHPIHLPAALPLDEGLLDWARAQSPDMWHEIACGIDFAAPQASVDLLMTVEWIVHQPECCRATALMFLARMVQAGLHDAAPARLAPEAAEALVAQLHANLAEGRYRQATYLLTEPQQILVGRHVGPEGALPLPPGALVAGHRHAQPPHHFLGWRPVQAIPATLSRAA